MSTYTKETRNPVTGEWEIALWMDDHFGRHRYGVRFPDGDVFTPDDVYCGRIEWACRDMGIPSRVASRFAMVPELFVVHAMDWLASMSEHLAVEFVDRATWRVTVTRSDDVPVLSENMALDEALLGAVEVIAKHKVEVPA